VSVTKAEASSSDPEKGTDSELNDFWSGVWFVNPLIEAITLTNILNIN
jgi:hypothetical protein